MSTATADIVTMQQQLLQNPIITSLKEGMTQRVTQLLQEGIPASIAKLTQQLEQAPFNMNFEAFCQAKLAESKRIIDAAIHHIKEVAAQLLTDASLLLTWVKLNMPKIEDGNK